ncbi:hypothetical protein C0Q70_12261 [Pomacea canaliculata]|uniref:Uncharacterized protein n=1 Tax=Pomacea canaliculata TaxID=400727 RepID=A0A2T7P113_POMCA|nr:hypothetical protein C0Q70_12261 [Pomacea canaliculata]
MSIACSENGVRRFRELSSTYISCSSLSPNTTLTWVFISLSGTSVSLGTCSANYSCVSLHPTVTGISRNYYTYSYIYFNATREMAGTLVCSELFSNGTTLSDNCTHDIVYPFQVDDVSVTTNLQDWTLTAVFSTQKVFSAMEFYYVDIKEYSTQMYEYRQYVFRLPPVVSKTSFQPYTDGQTYYRGTLTVTWSFPSKGGNYYYTGDIVPSGPTDLRIHPKIRGYIKISEPSPPSTNCRLTYVPEVGPISCQCSTTSLGTPPGRLMWLVGNDVIASGQDGVTQLQFPTNRLNRTHDGLQVTCQLNWVVKHHVVVTDNVAYCSVEMARSTMAQSVGTSVGVTVGVLVLLVCSVLVVLWIRRRRATGGPKQKSDDGYKDSQEHHYAGLFQTSGRETTHSNAEHNASHPGSDTSYYQNVQLP